MRYPKTFCLAALFAATTTLAGSPLIAHGAAAKGKLGLGKGGRTPSMRAGIPPEAFGSPVASPDKSRWAWIADDGTGPNLFVGNRTRKVKTRLTNYNFTPANDIMPGLPILWSPDGRWIAFYSYSHSATNPATSSHAVVVNPDSAADIRMVLEPSGDLDTRPTRWQSEDVLVFKGLKEANLNGGESVFVYEVRAGSSQLESAWLSAQAAARAHADSTAAAGVAVPAAGGK